MLYLGWFLYWISSLVRVENSYAWGLAGYTALIIVITIQPEPLLTPQFAVERCSEIVIGIVCAIVADLLFFSTIDQTRSGSRAGKFAGGAISTNAIVHQTW